MIAYSKKGNYQTGKILELEPNDHLWYPRKNYKSEKSWNQNKMINYPRKKYYKTCKIQVLEPTDHLSKKKELPDVRNPVIGTK